MAFKREKILITALDAVARMGITVPGCLASCRCPGDFGFENYCHNKWGKECRLCWGQLVVFDTADSLENFIEGEQQE